MASRTEKKKNVAAFNERCDRNWNGFSFLSLLITALLLLSGCSALNFNTHAKFIIDPLGPQDVSISKDAWSWEKGFHYEHEGKDSTVIKLNNSENVHLIRAEKQGYFPTVTPVFNEFMNPLKLLDLGLAVGGAVTGGAGLTQESGIGMASIGFFMAFYNGLGLAANPKKVYAKRYELKALEKLPLATATDPMIRMEGFHMFIPEGAHCWTYYADMDRFEKNHIDFKNASDEEVSIRYSNLDEDLSAVLQIQGFQPDDREGMFQHGDAIQITGQLTAVKENRVQSIVAYDLTTEWWVYNAYGMQTDTVKIQNQSNWGVYNFSDPGFDRDLIAEALTHAMFMAIQKPTMNRSLSQPKDLDADWKEGWEVIQIQTPSKAVGKISSALSSVVTIDAVDGHGSGCVISSDGYIITNQHVVSDPSLEYTVYFQDGSSKTAQIVRHHPVFDLALLHVDTTRLQPFHLELSATIDVGEEAYAMGTPYDIDLGASVSKGIISGRRNDGERTLIQTDVSISPGNSGGALVLKDGTLIGIVNEKVLGFGIEGIGFAIPTHYIKDALMIDFVE